MSHQSTIYSTKRHVLLKFNVEDNDRTGSKYYSPLVAALVEIVHEKGTSFLHAVYAKLLSEGFFIHNSMILTEGLAYTASNASSSFCTLSLPWPMCAGGMNALDFARTAVCCCNTHLLSCLRSGYQCWYSPSTAL